MGSELTTSWSQYDASLSEILPRAAQTVRIFDEDLVKLKLERSDNVEVLRSFLGSSAQNRLQIIIRDAGPLRRNSPRLMKLLADYSDKMAVTRCPEHLISLSDSLVICDDCHALVRFHEDHARAKLIVDSAADCAPYVRRFEDLLSEGGEPISATTLGL